MDFDFSNRVAILKEFKRHCLSKNKISEAHVCVSLFIMYFGKSRRNCACFSKNMNEDGMILFVSSKSCLVLVENVNTYRNYARIL